MKTIILTNGLIDLEKERILASKAIVVEDRLIADILDIDELGEDILRDAQIVEAGDKYILPGLIDRHLHLIFSGKDNPLRDFLDATKENLYQTALQKCREALACGITTVRDCGSFSDLTLRLREEIGSGQAEGARVLTSGEAITTTGGHIYFVGLEADSGEEMKEAADRLIGKGVDFIKLVVSGGNMTPGSSDLKDQYSYEQIRELVDHVHSRGKKVMAHIHTREGMLKAIEAGVDFIEHGSWRSEKGIDVLEDKIREMKEKGIVYGTALPRSYTTNNGILQQNRIRTTLMNMQYIDNVVLGTDAGTTDNPVSGLIDQAVFLGQKGGFTNFQMLRMLTLNPGRTILPGKIGEIKKGYFADLLILDEDPTRDLANLRNIYMVIKEGKIIE